MTKTILTALPLLLLGACSPKTVYVPVESATARVDSVFISRKVHDTIREKETVYEAETRYDSIAPVLDSLNRVIGWDRYHFRGVTKMNDLERERLLAVIDSLKQQSADTVVQKLPYPVERKLTAWERTRMDFGGMAIGGFAVAVIAVAWLIFMKRRR